MDEDTLQRSLRARPPADPAYRPRLTDPRATIAPTGSPGQDRVQVQRPTLRTRFLTMNATLKLAAVAVLALVVGIGVVQLRPSTNDVGSDPSPSASPTESPTPARLPDGPLPAGTYVAMPFAALGSDACYTPPQSGCSEAIPDDDIRVTLTVPDGLSGVADLGVGLPLDERNTPTWAEVIVERGAWLLTDPCQNGKSSDIPVGPTAMDFAMALVGTELDVTGLEDVTLAGYSGKYLELQVPRDITACDVYRPWEPGIFAKWPGERWLLWILDAGGLRVIVREMVHEGTTPEVRAQLQGVIDSIEIEPAPPQDWPAPVRAEPVGDPVIVPLAGGYTDPSGDIESFDVPWVDIQSVTAANGKGRVWVDVVASPPSPRGDSNEPRIAYGLVFDTDLDGVADVRHGMDRIPAELTPWGATPGDVDDPAQDADWDVRAWRTDLRTGTTESGNSDSSVCDCLYPGEGGATAYIYPGQDIPGRFYAWASVIEDGRVVATDYAPDSGWLDPTGSIPAGTPAASPSQ